MIDIKFTFQNLWFFPFFILILALYFFRERKRTLFIKQLSSSLNHNFLLNYSRIKSFFKRLFFILGLLFLFVALLGPSWENNKEIVKQHGRDLYVILDVSKSMLAEDVKPNRLNLAKHKINSLLNSLDTDRIGLILFSGSAFVQCPLTRDKKVFKMFLDQVDVETISSGTTALDKALNLGINQFPQTDAKRTKLLILFSDGEDFSHNLEKVKTRAQKSGINIFVFGIGTVKGAPIPLFAEDGNLKGHQLDKEGKIVISSLNESLIKQLASDCGGNYIASGETNNDVMFIKSKIDQFEKNFIEEKKLASLENQYPVFVLISLIFFLLEWLL